MDKAKALELAEKVLALVEGGKTPGERAAAQAALDRLMSHHDISLTEVRERKIVEEVIVAEVKHEYWRIHQWIKILAANVAIAFHCKVVFSFYPDPTAGPDSTRPNLRRYIFIGPKSEAEQSAFFFDVFHAKLSVSAEQTGREEGFEGKELLAYVNAYVVSAARVIREKLEQYNHQQMLDLFGLRDEPDPVAQQENGEGPSDESEFSAEEQARLDEILARRQESLSEFLSESYDHATRPNFSIARRVQGQTDVSVGLARGLLDGESAGMQMPIHPGIGVGGKSPGAYRKPKALLCGPSR